MQMTAPTLDGAERSVKLVLMKNPPYSLRYPLRSRAGIFYQVRGNRSNEIPWTWHQGQMKTRAGFLFSRSLTLTVGRRHFIISLLGLKQGPVFPYISTTALYPCSTSMVTFALNSHRANVATETRLTLPDTHFHLWKVIIRA